MNFGQLIIPLKPNLTLDGHPIHTLKEAQDIGAPVIAIGQFINVVIDFLIVAFCIFLLVKGINWLKREKKRSSRSRKKRRRNVRTAFPRSFGRYPLRTLHFDA